jgi:hypothetical protein
MTTKTKCGFDGCDRPYDDGHTHELTLYGYFSEHNDSEISGKLGDKNK